ncbi:MAG: hypothetical protein JO037_00785 [Actinobacteria bacterium]|nr:hypothetical protein [Actinomycetota bacterium]
MNPGDMGQDVSQPGPDEASGPGSAGGPARITLAEPRTPETLQDIQDIIDKLEAITRQLRRPSRSGSSLADPVELGGKAAQ